MRAPTISGEDAIFTLVTGERVRICLAETGLGTFGYALKITADRGTLLVQPSSGNSIELYTPKSLQTEKAEHDRIVAARTSGVPEALPFDREYVSGYLSEVLAEATGNADQEVQKLLAWLADGVGVLPQLDAATVKAGEPEDVRAWLDSRRRCKNPRCESWGCAKHDAGVDLPFKEQP